jgi:hypothetical protein
MDDAVISEHDLSPLIPTAHEFTKKLVRAAHMLDHVGFEQDGTRLLCDDHGVTVVQKDGTIYHPLDESIEDPGEFMDAVYQELLLALIARNRAEKHRSS